MRTIFLPKDKFDALDKIVSCAQIINGRILGTFIHQGKEYAATGCVGNGKGTGNSVVWATEVVDYLKYRGKRKAVTYDEHEGTGYSGMITKLKNRVLVFTHNEIEVKQGKEISVSKTGWKRISLQKVKELLQFPGQLQNQIKFMEDQVVRTEERWLQEQDHDQKIFFRGINTMTKEILMTLESCIDRPKQWSNDKSLQVGSAKTETDRRLWQDMEDHEKGRARCRQCFDYFTQYNKKKVFCSNACRIMHHRKMK